MEVLLRLSMEILGQHLLNALVSSSFSQLAVSLALFSITMCRALPSALKCKCFGLASPFQTFFEFGCSGGGGGGSGARVFFS